jgi:hypothetical protein
MLHAKNWEVEDLGTRQIILIEYVINIPAILVHTLYLRMMALKKNGQERSKLHLTLSLGGSETDCGHTTEAPRVPICQVIQQLLVLSQQSLWWMKATWQWRKNQGRAGGLHHDYIATPILAFSLC